MDAWFACSAFEAGENVVYGYHLRESVSRLFEIELFIARDDDLPMDADATRELLRGPCALVLGERHAPSEPMYGVLREWSLLECAPGHQTLYRAVMVPSLWVLTQTLRSRVFQALSVPDILRAVLDEHGFVEDQHYSVSVEASYPEREYVAQYEESDFDFLARLLEHEGIFFFFDCSEGTDLAVFGDANGAFIDADTPDVRYVPRADRRGGEETFHRVQRRHRVVPHRVVIRDSNYRTPLVPLQCDAEVHADGRGLVALYGDHFPDDGEGSRIATVRAQEIATDEERCVASGYVPSLRSGRTFALTDHPLDELDRDYVVIEIERRRDQEGPDTDVDRFTLLPRSVPYRPARETPKPRIFGYVHARIDGEIEGTPAPIDDQGRYRVLLPFDGVGELGGRASRWMRRAQVYAGPAYGMHFPLHIGAEVLLAHLDGDPDRPIIAAAIPNPATSSPVTSENPTQSVLRTKGQIVQEWEDDA
ncbi:MAG TPA: hypothetical protein DEF51_23360 [Myxococcales bacterium]|nr:hypothetical protein [Myxococcales bacterium]